MCGKILSLLFLLGDKGT